MIFSIWSLFGPQFVIVWLCSWSGHVLVILLSLSDSVFCRYFVIIFILCIIWSTSCHFIVIVWCSSLSDHYLVIILGIILWLACHFLSFFVIICFSSWPSHYLVVILSFWFCSLFIVYQFHDCHHLAFFKKRIWSVCGYYMVTFWP